MNRKQRKAYMREVHAYLRTLPEELRPVPAHEFPTFDVQPFPVKAWRSRKYLVQAYEENSTDYPGLIRLSICRSTPTLEGGSWIDGLTWDELQAIKREIGYGEWYGVEVFPADKDFINVANFRHLWLLPKPLSIGWFEDVEP